MLFMVSQKAKICHKAENLQNNSGVVEAFSTELWPATSKVLTLTVLVTTIVALGHFETGLLQHSARGWGR